MIRFFNTGLHNLFKEPVRLAFECDSHIEDYREFVVIRSHVTSNIRRFNVRFPYLAGSASVFHIIRFRVPSELIDQAASPWEYELLDLQEIYLPGESGLLEEILETWGLSLAQMAEAQTVELPSIVANYLSGR